MAEFKVEYTFRDTEWTAKIFDGKGERWPATVRGELLRIVRQDVFALVAAQHVTRLEEFVEFNSLTEYLGN